MPGRDAVTVDPAAVSPARPAASVHYDARRGVHYSKPLLRGWSHLLWFAASLVAGPLLTAAAGTPREVVGAGVYAACLSGLFGVSALYHVGTWSPRAGRILQRADHVMIFLLIAGTATPVLLLATPGALGRVGLVVLWCLTTVAIGAHLVRMDAPEWLVGGVFIGLGVAAAVGVPGVWVEAGVAAAVLVLAGGLLYIVGAAGYHRRRPDPSPTLFGYHEVFHAFVCAAATCHFVAIAQVLGS